jgi:hypothetical protein
MWKDNKLWGQGTFMHPKGVVYSGVWENSEPVPGSVTRNGQPWHGSQVDLLNGQHVIYHQKGEPFEQIHIIFADESRYEGGWQDGKRFGHGRHTLPTGAAYDGIWKDNKLWGQGTFMHPKGVVYSGVWENSEPVPGSVTRNGQPWHGSQVDLLNRLTACDILVSAERRTI